MSDPVRILVGDCLEAMRGMDAASVDAIVTDPPYGLSFMGKHWDHGVPGVDFWVEALRVAKPGTHLLAFGGTRTWHRLACAVEDAGFEVRDSIAWLYGSGFPKSLDVSKAIDKRANVNDETHRRIALVAEVIRTHREAKGMERSAVSLAVVGTPSGACWNWEHQQLPSAEMWPAIKRVLDIPDKFDGLIEGTRAQFIGAERVITGMHHQGNAIGNYELKHGVGKGRTANERRDAPATPDAERWQGWGTALKPAFEPIIVARKPLIGTVAENVTTHGTGAMNVDACRVRGEPWKAHRATGLARDKFLTSGPAAEIDKEPHHAGRWPANLIHDGSAEVVGLFPSDGEQSAARFFYCAKASRRDREEGCSDTHAAMRNDGRTTAIDNPYQRGKVLKNHHPTVKPTDLMRYLCRLVTPPGGIVLDPFAGSGSTGKGAVLEGFNFIGIELDAEYAEIARARIGNATPADKGLFA